MNDILNHLTSKTLEAIQALWGQEAEAAQVQFQKTRKEFEGHLTLVVFPLLKISRAKPEQTAELLGKALLERCADSLSGFNVIKGFLNLSLSEAYFIQMLRTIAQQDDFGIRQPSQDAPTVLVEYASPNTNKPLHLGHVRNILLGNSLARVLAAAGKHVKKVQVVNDRGIHICKSMLAYQKFGQGIEPSAELKGDHLVGRFYVRFDQEHRLQIQQLVEQGMDPKQAKDKAPILLEAQEMLRQWEAGEPAVRALWERMNQWVYQGFDATYADYGVDFDKNYYESQTYELGKRLVLEAVGQGILQQKDDGSVWADLTADGLDEKVLLRSDGTSVYMTQDIGTALLRHDEFQFDHMVYVVGNEQEYHFKALKLILAKMGHAWAGELTHLSYGMVELPEGKMKSREGKVVDADDLFQEMLQTARQTALELGKLDELSPEEQLRTHRMIALGAVKYFILKVNPKKTMLFNPAESIDFNGNTGPFIQYTHARVSSLLRKAAERQLWNPEQLAAFETLSAKEAELVQLLAELPAQIQQAADEFSPALLANYCYELTKTYNQFYNDFPILREENPESRALRLLLSANVAKVLRLAMGLLGIELPERM